MKTEPFLLLIKLLERAATFQCSNAWPIMIEKSITQFIQILNFFCSQTEEPFLFRSRSIKARDKKRLSISPIKGLSIPLINCSCQTTWVCVPSSGIPSTMGTSISLATLVCQNANLHPSLPQIKAPMATGIKEIIKQMLFIFKMEIILLGSTILLKAKENT